MLPAHASPLLPWPLRTQNHDLDFLSSTCCAAIPVEAASWSFSGFATAIAAIDVHPFPGVIYFIGAALWCLEATWCLWCIKDVSAGAPHVLMRALLWCMEGVQVEGLGLRFIKD